MAEKLSESCPIPSHLLGWVTGTSYKDKLIEATIRCPCGREQLEFHYLGVTQLCKDLPHPCSVKIEDIYFFIIKAVCPDCRQGRVIFDGLFHGKADFLNVDPSAFDLPSPRLWPWRCLECGSAVHHGQVGIATDKDRYFEFGYAERFGVERWPDVFHWFHMSIKCAGCGYNIPEWVSYESK
jgi:hypothetical protein